MILFPEPKQMKVMEGTYTLHSSVDLCDLMAFVRNVRGGTDEIRLHENLLLRKEEYVLSVCDTGVDVYASCEEGFFRALTSLHQMIRRGQGVLPLVEIQDAPDIARRGYMVDISRGKMPKVETIKRMADYLAKLKYNELQLYMEGDCFKYAAYPKETAHFDCLTPEDIRELDAYCRERFIDLVPNQNSFGHMYTWLKKPEFHHLGLFEADETPSTLNPLLEESFEFMCNLYASLLPHFSSQYVNIGLDEAYGLGKFQIEEYCKEKGKDIVFME